MGDIDVLPPNGVLSVETPFQHHNPVIIVTDDTEVHDVTTDCLTRTDDSEHCKPLSKGRVSKPAVFLKAGFRKSRFF